MRLLKSTAILGIVALFASTSVSAQLGGPAPMPKIAKPSGPTLEETTAWILQKFATLPVTEQRNWPDPGMVVYPNDYKYRAFFGDCELYIAESYKKWDLEGRRPPVITPGERPWQNELRISYIPLREVDLDRFKIKPQDVRDARGTESARLEINTLGDRNKIVSVRHYVYNAGPHIADTEFLMKEIHTLKTPPYPRVSYDPIWYVWIYLPDVDVTERMASAIKHAAMLCQQKAAQEKAAQPPKPKELF